MFFTAAAKTATTDSKSHISTSQIHHLHIHRLPSPSPLISPPLPLSSASKQSTCHPNQCAKRGIGGQHLTLSLIQEAHQEDEVAQRQLLDLPASQPDELHQIGKHHLSLHLPELHRRQLPLSALSNSVRPVLRAADQALLQAMSSTLKRLRMTSEFRQGKMMIPSTKSSWPSTCTTEIP